MAQAEHKLANGASHIDFRTSPENYRHWRLAVDGAIATLSLDVDENAGLFEGYQLKLNSYDLGVDIELADAVRRLRFEYPQVKAVVMRSAKNRVFCAGANIRMLAGASHAHKVNFCKFTNETRNGIEDATEHSGIHFVCAINGTAAGGGYELALAAGHIMLVDDGSSAVSLPELPLLAVLPGTGGLTRVTDKRKVRRDLADVFCTIEEGIKGKRAVQWRLVDEVVPQTGLEARATERARELAGSSKRAGAGAGIKLTPLPRKLGADSIAYGLVNVAIDRALRTATITIAGPDSPPPADAEAFVRNGADNWVLRAARELDDALLHLRNNEFEIGTFVFKTVGDIEILAAHNVFLGSNRSHWLIHEVTQLWKSVIKRIDVTSRSLVALIEPGSCFAGALAEIAFACDRSYMLIGQKESDNKPPATLMLSGGNFGSFPMGNGITRLQSRFIGEPEQVEKLRSEIGKPIDAEQAEQLGLITCARDDLAWDDEVRMFIEERKSYSPDALTGMEANLRFAGPETMETKIFARLTAWQNWIFQRPNAVGEEGALRRYGSGQKAAFDLRRV
jgi:benzoyl-CoA-dihydrodiol lyase